MPNAQNNHFKLKKTIEDSTLGVRPPESLGERRLPVSYLLLDDDARLEAMASGKKAKGN